MLLGVKFKFPDSFSACEPVTSVDEWSEVWCSDISFHDREQFHWTLGIFQAYRIMLQISCLSLSWISPSKAVRAFEAAKGKSI